MWDLPEVDSILVVVVHRIAAEGDSCHAGLRIPGPLHSGPDRAQVGRRTDYTTWQVGMRSANMEGK